MFSFFVVPRKTYIIYIRIQIYSPYIFRCFDLTERSGGLLPQNRVPTQTNWKMIQVGLQQSCLAEGDDLLFLLHIWKYHKFIHNIHINMCILRLIILQRIYEQVQCLEHPKEQTIASLPTLILLGYYWSKKNPAIFQPWKEKTCLIQCMYTWTFQRVPNGFKGCQHPIGFIWHPLEGAGIYIYNIIWLHPIFSPA